MRITILLALLLVGWSVQAATLKEQYRDKNNDFDMRL